MASKHTKSFKDSMEMASDLIYDFVCSPCQEDKLNTEAKYFCGDCSKYYCDKCLPFHSKILKQHTVLGRRDVDKWLGQGDALILCDLHPQEVIKLLCEDHAEMCCHLCVSLNHRMCRSISLISDLAKGVYKMADFKQLSSNVAKITTSLNQEREVRKKNQCSLKTSGKSMLTKITDLRKSLNQLLDELEKKTVKQMDSVLADLDVTLQKDIDSCALIHNQLNALLNTIKAQAKDNEPSSYNDFWMCEEKMAEANSLLQEMSTKPELTATFQSDTRVTQLLSNMHSLGKIQGYQESKKISEQIRPLPDKSRGFVVKNKSTFNVNIKQDTKTCDIMGITELPSGEIILLDTSNKRVKVLNKEYKVITQCDVLPKPEDISVDCGDRDEVQFLTVSAGTIKMTRKFSVNHDCKSIKHHGDQLYVGSNTALYLYTTNGKQVKKLYQDTPGGWSVAQFAVNQVGKRIYICDFTNNKIKTIDSNGNVLASLKDQDIIEPYSVHVSEGGHVFVCSLCSKTVVQVDQEGRKKLATLVGKGDGVNYPQAVWYSTHTGRLIVGGGQDDIVVMELQ
ncbi:uncharacterized protein LOC128244087 [Mya arenaria]|uniref:uncharacterized protein LOC128244087 n=1 Tax=Mya arenaria TaxID=6604 RepID=UPI0022E49B10|nr:uncharacterized protein LOC128244087 [Mya arenaria]